MLIYGFETIAMNKSEMTKFKMAETIGVTGRSRNAALWEALNLTETQISNLKISNLKMSFVER